MRFCFSSITQYDYGALASRPARTVVCDECCKFAKASADEASAMSLADQRTKTFRELAKRIKVSTPTSVEDEFWQAFLAGDGRYNHVPCPNCHKTMILNHVLMDDPENVEAIRTAPEDAEATLTWDKKASRKDGQWDLKIVAETARFRCVHCEYPISDHEKPSILLLGEWHPSLHNAAASYRSYQLTSFYSPDVTFGQMAGHFLKGRTLFGLQDYFNGWLGLPYQESLIEVDTESVLKLRDDRYRVGHIPAGPRRVSRDRKQSRRMRRMWIR